MDEVFADFSLRNQNGADYGKNPAQSNGRGHCDPIEELKNQIKLKIKVIVEIGFGK